MSQYIILIAELHKQRVRVRKWLKKNGIVYIDHRGGIFEIPEPPTKEEREKLNKWVKRQVLRGDEFENYKGQHISGEITVYLGEKIYRTTTDKLFER